MSDPSRASIDVEVRYFETDAMGVVHHANYLVWFELARTRLCADSGRHYADIEADGYRLVNTRVEVVYRRPARYGETCRVACWIDTIGSRSLGFSYEVSRDGQVLVTGSTEHLWIESESGRPCRMPEPYRVPFLRLAGQEP